MTASLHGEDFFGFDSGAEEEDDDEVASWRSAIASRARPRPQSADPSRRSAITSAQLLDLHTECEQQYRRHSHSCVLHESQSSTASGRHHSARAFQSGTADDSLFESTGRHFASCDLGQVRRRVDASKSATRSGQNRNGEPVKNFHIEQIRSFRISIEELQRDRSTSRNGRCMSARSNLMNSKHLGALTSRLHSSPVAPPPQQNRRPRPASAGSCRPHSNLPPGWVLRPNASQRTQSPRSQSVDSNRRSSSSISVQSGLQPQAPPHTPCRTRSPRDLNSLLLADGIRGCSIQLPPRPPKEPLPAHRGAEASCVICLERLCSGGSGGLQALACGHTFHSCCIRHWLATKPTCPLCKTPVEMGGS